eukprot:2601119-Amphidinium_carterae.1
MQKCTLKQTIEVKWVVWFGCDASGRGRGVSNDHSRVLETALLELVLEVAAEVCLCWGKRMIAGTCRD